MLKTPVHFSLFGHKAACPSRQCISIELKLLDTSTIRSSLQRGRFARMSPAQCYSVLACWYGNVAIVIVTLLVVNPACCTSYEREYDQAYTSRSSLETIPFCTRQRHPHNELLALEFHWKNHLRLSPRQTRIICCKFSTKCSLDLGSRIYTLA